MSSQGRVVYVPHKGKRIQNPDGSFRNLNLGEELREVVTGSPTPAVPRYRATGAQRITDSWGQVSESLNAKDGGGFGYRKGTQPVYSDAQGNKYDAVSGKLLFAAPTPAAAPAPVQGAGAPPVAPALARATAGAQALRSSTPAAAAARPIAAPAAAPAGTPIAAGARDLSDASSQLARIFGNGGSAGMTTDDAILRGQAAGAFDKLPMNATADQAIGAAMNAGALDAPAPSNTAAGGTTSMDLAERRRRAFLDAPDSMEGMKRVRMVLADEIGNQGGDLQKFAADSGQMRPMGVRQLEGYLDQLKNGANGTGANGTGANAEPGANLDTSVVFNAPAENQAAATQRAQSVYNNPPSLSAAAGLNTGVAFNPAGNKLPAGFDQFLTTNTRAQIQANPANANTGTLDYQNFRQVTPGENGAPDANALSAGAAAGLDPKLLTPDGMRQMYAAQNANMLFGGGKPGATAPLPQLTDEDLARMSAVKTRFVTPPAGFDFYNRG